MILLSGYLQFTLMFLYLLFDIYSDSTLQVLLPSSQLVFSSLTIFHSLRE